MRLRLLLPLLPFLALVGTLLPGGPAAAQPSAAEAAPPATPSGPLTARPVEELDQDPNEPRLGNGSVANAADWPATFIADFVANGRPEFCTSTLVGPRALLTAAHCIGTPPEIRFTSRNRSFVADCTRPQPGFPQTRSADWALCLVRGGPVAGIAYERMRLDAALTRRDRLLLLTGFGCQMSGGVQDQRFRTGPSRIQFAAGEMPSDPFWAATHAGSVTGDAFICQGDSGGAVYVTTASGQRLVVAVNSHSDQPPRGVSFLSVLGTPQADAYIRQWMAQTGETICGISGDAPNCRD